MLDPINHRPDSESSYGSRGSNGQAFPAASPSPSPAPADEIFTKEYYENIWEGQGVHRHDYCESLANSLIEKYGKVRILDIGTGCGYLVKTLREKGCDAWGLEISDYAIANSCAPGYVLKGSIADIPFKDYSFDVVHSQGVWGYFPEEDIQKAWNECLRVGKNQHHNIDYEDTIAEHEYLIIKDKNWWDARLVIPNILVTCPTYEGKEYCFQQWIDNVKNLTYPNYDILVVDNSKTADFYNRWKDKVPMEHIETNQEPDQWLNRICQSMAHVQKKFLEGNYTHWMNIEADNIPPKNVIETLLKYGKDADWISHCYLVNPNGETLEQGIGCSLLSRKLMTDFNWNEAADSPDAELWNFVRPSKKYKTVELWGIMEVKHLKE